MTDSGVLGPRLRDLGESDLEWVAQQERVIFGSAAWSAGLIREDWRYGTNRYRGVEVDGELSAYAIYGFEGDAFHLMNLAVAPEHRRQGLAKVLMDDFLAEAGTFHAPDAWLEVAVDNEAARGLYESYGFEVVRVRPKYYQPGGVDALVMRRELRGYEPTVSGREESHAATAPRTLLESSGAPKAQANEGSLVVKKVGIREVAAVAGVSTTTVSHALNGLGSMTDETRRRVVEVARELNYRPNRMASALRREKSHTIGFVDDTVATTPFAVAMLKGAQDAAVINTYSMIVASSAANPELEAHEIALLRSFPVDGLIVGRMFHQYVDLDVAALGLPIVLVNARARDDGVASFVPDEDRIGSDATRELIDAGHRDIAHLSIVTPGCARDGRVTGYREAISGVARERIVYASEATTQSAREAALPLLRSEDRPTAIFCFNDQMAMGVYQAAQRLGLRIPSDISVIGVDDLLLIAAALDPALTTVALPHYEMGQRAVESVVALIDGAPVEGVTTQLVCRVVRRESIVPPAVRSAFNA
ncbi:MAG: GNAT family N-acetyltransferase [Demequina sp.]|nr:GNAT family N-acetyltransferase [Demequina sp.]